MQEILTKLYCVIMNFLKLYAANFFLYLEVLNNYFIPLFPQFFCPICVKIYINYPQFKIGSRKTKVPLLVKVRQNLFGPNTGLEDCRSLRLP
jgi:hypothetical protein